MDSDRNILIICEGDFEVKLFRKLNALYPYNLNFSFYVYKTNIHIFGKAVLSYCHDNDFDITDVDIIQLLKELRHAPALDLKYTDILLVFDFDPHDPRFDIDLIIQLQEYFYDSTTQGQLYINYPMAESAIDFSCLPDLTFNDKRVSSHRLNRSQYKNLVKTTSCINNIDNLDQIYLPQILKHKYLKLFYLVGIHDSKYIDLLQQECTLHMTVNLIDVINTSLMFFYDYNKTLFLNYINE